MAAILSRANILKSLEKKLLIAKIFNSCSSINISDAAGLTKSSEDKKLTIWFDFSENKKESPSFTSW